MATGIFKLRDQLLGLVQKAWTGSQTTPAVEYLVVGGGGGSPSNWGGGGGAGGLLQGILPVTNGTTYTVTVGTGGTGGVGSSTWTATSGLNSSLGNVTALGGGAGGYYTAGVNSGVSGGSGGGGDGAGAGKLGGNGASGQGNAGGNSFIASNAGTYQQDTSGGGGGAGTKGLSGNGDLTLSAGQYYAGNGGAGIASAISGTVTTYAGGGGGCVNGANIIGNGGVGGGGNGGSYTSGTSGVSGSTNTGGGGGGGPYNYNGGNGGSGIAIISYPDTYNAPTAVTGTYTASTSGSGSLSFSGSSQYISYTSNAAFALPGDFTLEMWIYPLNWTASGMYLYVTYPGTDGGLMFGKNGSNFVIRAANVADQLTYGTLPTINAWTHIVAVRSGTTLSMYYNGTRVATTTNSYSFSQALLKIGSDGYGSDFPGYISNVRLVKGTAVYSPSSTTLTVPTAPLTAISGTSILLTTVSPDGYLDSSTNSFTPTLTGTPTWNQSSPFATGLGYKNRVYTWTGNGTVTF